MITPWDYANTELPCTHPNRSEHMKEMGTMGWELVSVNSNPATGAHVFFWKRPLEDGQKITSNGNTSTHESPHKEMPIARLGEVRATKQEPFREHKFNREIPASNYELLPKPQIVMIVKYRPKEGCFNEFRDELYKRDYPNCIARHMGFNEQKEFICLSLMESIDAALDLEGVGTNWLDSVDHLLIKYPNGSRTESFSGPVWGWYPNFENFKIFDKHSREFNVVLVKMKASKIDDCKNLILRPSNAPNKLFKCVAQYKDTDDTVILLSLDALKDQVSTEDNFEIEYCSLLEQLIVKEETRKFFSGAEDFVWLNKISYSNNQIK